MISDVKVIFQVKFVLLDTVRTYFIVLLTYLSPLNVGCYSSLYLNIPGLVALLVITVGCGLVIYANYQGCDPVQRGIVKSADQVRSFICYIDRQQLIVIHNFMV